MDNRQEDDTGNSHGAVNCKWEVTKVGKCWQILAVVGLVLGGAGVLAAQEGGRLWLGEPDVAAFPTVRVPLYTADSLGAPINDLSRLSLRENGIPLDVTVTAVPTGLDIFFVLDTNADFTVVDDNSGLTRAEKVTESIVQFAGRFMSRNGDDQVSVIVPGEDGRGGRFLIQNRSNPDIIAQTITAYTPEPLAETPLNAMLNLALEQAAQNGSGRYQAILLFTDGGQLNRQLVFDDLATAAQAIDLPIFTAILGATADANELANVNRLTEPTGGGAVHMPAPDDVTPIYLAWQGQANQTWLVYQSLQTKNGRYPITVNLGNVRARTELALALAAPEVAVQLPSAEIRRTGRANDTSLADLEPTHAAVPVVVSWPDGIPRPLTAVALLVGGPDGQTSAITEIQPDAAGRLEMDWDVQLAREGIYQLVVQVADSLGYTAESEPVSVTILIERPDPPTPTPAPTIVPETAVPPPPAIAPNRLWLALGLSLLAGLGAILLLWRRWRQSRTLPEPDAAPAPESIAPETAPILTGLLPAYLEIEGIQSQPLTGDNIIIGRDETIAQLALDGPGVARLHARIRWRDGRYWLYDEGSAAGTHLNFERLGLAPRPLQDGDQIQIGRLRLHFRLGEPAEEEE